MIRGRFLVIAVLAGLFVSAAAVGSAAENLTVGDFVVMVASRVSPATAHLTPATAAELLKKNGIRVQTDLSSPLTEGEAADLFSQFGITLQSDRPSSQLERSKAEALLRTFGETLAARSTANPVMASSGKGNNSTSPTITLEDALDDCQNLPKVHDCQLCCKALGVYANKACSQACSNSPKASAVEPTP